MRADTLVRTVYDADVARSQKDDYKRDARFRQDCLILLVQRAI